MSDNQYIQEFKEYLKGKLSFTFQEEYCDKKNALILHVARENLQKLLTFLRDDKRCEFSLMIDLFGADFPERERRFEVTYSLLSLRFNARIYIKVQVNEDEYIPSVVNIYTAACWFEREVWDMYGVIFDGNPDLRRILTDYGFDGHPLRKDFPVTGFVEVRYDIEKKRVVYEKVKLDQEFRNFDFMSPWEGAKYVLPGDEKATK